MFTWCIIFAVSNLNDTIMQTVKVIFRDERFNYRTTVSSNSTRESVNECFVGQFFNVGAYPVENMQECINVEIECAFEGSPLQSTLTNTDAIELFYDATVAAANDQPDSKFWADARTLIEKRYNKLKRKK